jgi:hypothetical protein
MATIHERLAAANNAAARIITLQESIHVEDRIRLDATVFDVAPLPQGTKLRCQLLTADEDQTNYTAEPQIRLYSFDPTKGITMTIPAAKELYRVLGELLV